MRARWLCWMMSAAALAATPFFGCSESSPPSGAGAGAAGGGGSGTGGQEAPDYDLAFPQDRVARLDITIAPDRWQAMLDDMTDMLGEFGEGSGIPGGPPPGGGGGGPGGPGIPPEAFEACAGLVAGDPCAVTTPTGDVIEGACADSPDGVFCMPAGGPGGDGVDLIPRTPIYVECDVATEDRTWRHVGVRFKGNSSLAMPWMQGVWKLPLRLNFDEFEDTYPEIQDQRFHGFKALGLSNGANDPSLLRDKIGTEVFVSAGIPAPATAFYRVFIDHGDGPTYFGLYTGIEIPSDSSFMDTHFGGHDGNLYKPDGEGARWATWDPDTLGKENHESEADFSDAQALFDALHADRTDAAAWRAGLEARLDVDGFLRWLALNTVIQDWDTYGLMPHNYYLYSEPSEGGRFRWIPWDHSFAFSPSMGPLSLSMAEVTDAWPLIRYLLDDPVYLDVYRGHVAQAAETEYEPAAAAARFTAAHDLIAPYVAGPEGEIAGHTFLSSPADFESALDALIAHASQRQADVAAYLGQ